MTLQKITRIGVYGVVRERHNILVVVQAKGPYVGRFDLPGGGIEFGETIEDALHREFLEEIGMDFDTMEWMMNLTANIEMPSYTFHQIGMIYSIADLSAKMNESAELKHTWVDIRTLSQKTVSPFLWAVILNVT